MTTRPLACIAAVAAAAAAAAARAQPQSPAATPQIKIAREVGAVREMALETGQNRLIVLSEQIGRIAVAEPAVADLKVITPTQVLLTAKGAGTTDLTLWNRDNEPLVIALRVARNLDPLRKQLAELFPGEKLTVSAAGDLVVLSGEVSDVRIPERVAEVARLHSPQVANLVKVAGNQQVQIEVRFAEVSRSGLRELGVNLFHKSRDGRDVGGQFAPGTFPGQFLNTVQNPSMPGTGPYGLAAPQQPPDMPYPPFTGAFSLFFSGYGRFPLSAMLSVLEGSGLARVLAEPTLVTLSGQEARFLAGGEFPIPISSALGQVNVEWKKFGILLGFTPTVIGESTIHLKLAAEVSDLDPTASITIAGTSIPGLSSRQSETTVRLGDGQSFVVAGLLSEKVRSQIDRVPVLGSIPVLGALFRSTRYQRSETELLVVVTAHLARPLAPHEVPPLPTEFETPPGDLALLLFGLDASSAVPDRPAPRPAARRGSPSGPSGFAR